MVSGRFVRLLDEPASVECRWTYTDVTDFEYYLYWSTRSLDIIRDIDILHFLATRSLDIIRDSDILHFGDNILENRYDIRAN